MQEQSTAPEETVERRIVTILFADLVGFTTLSERFDPEDIALIQDRYFATVRETIGRYGGRLEKFIGDAAMAVFGVPRARDDDAGRAVKAGLALIHGVQQIGTELGLDEADLRLRVGINTGEAVIASGGPDEGRVTGDTVNTASRLQASAPPGGVLVGETTALAVAEVAEFGPQQALDLKGKAEPTAARTVTGVRSEASREQAMGDLHAPTLGREEELATLLDANGRAAIGGVERWLVVAPPGVGKSRLLRELADALGRQSSPTVVWRSRARPDSLSPFDPIAGLMLDALKAVDATAAEKRLRAALASAGVSKVRADVVVEACLSVIWPPGSAAGEQEKPGSDREAQFTAWLDGLDAIAADATQAWLVEDVHWAGGDVLAFLDFASTRAAKRLIVATARPSLLEAHVEWAADDPDSGRHTLRLAALQPTDARALVNALVGDALPVELVERIAERSDGNCLFIEELLRTWVSVGTLVPDRDGGRDGRGRPAWRLAVPTDQIPLPASVQQIYAAQLDDLPTDARRLARRASVAGRRFPVGALEPLGAAEAGLEPLKRRELLVGPVTEPLWGEAFAYRHALLRDAGYASLARAERARLHVRLARWLEQAAGARSTEIAEVIAGHYSAALESAPSLATEIGDGLDRDSVGSLAAEWYERAGQGTLSLAAHDAARQMFKRSIDLTAENSTLDKARRWERLGDATAFAADMDEGAAAYQKAMDLYRVAMGTFAKGFDFGSNAMNRAADQMMAKLSKLDGLSPEGAKEFAEGAAALRRGSAELQLSKAELAQSLSTSQAGLARTAAALGDVWYQQLRFADARDLAAATLAELPDADSSSTARLLVAKARGEIGASGYTPQIQADVEHAVELARGAGDARTEVRALTALAAIKSEGGADDPSDWQFAEKAALRIGDWNAAIQAATNGAIAWLDDQPDSVLPLIEQARETAAAHGMTEQVGWTSYVETEAAFVSGEWDRAVAVGTHVLDLADSNAYRRLSVRTLHVMLPIAGVRADTDMLRRAARFYESIDGKFVFPESPYARLVRAAQDIELAAAGLIPAFVPDVESRIVSFADEPSGPSHSAALDRLIRAWLDAGEVDGAQRALEQLTAVMPHFAHQVTSLGFGTYELLHGRVALARDDSAEAVARAGAALARFRVSNSPWWIAKAIRLAERSGTADQTLMTEAAEIERRLGAIEPTR